MKSAPCKGCPRRKLLCHGACKEYQDYQKAIEEVRQKRKVFHDCYMPLTEARIRMIRENRRGKRK